MTPSMGLHLDADLMNSGNAHVEPSVEELNYSKPCYLSIAFLLTHVYQFGATVYALISL